MLLLTFIIPKMQTDDDSGIYIYIYTYTLRCCLLMSSLYMYFYVLCGVYVDAAILFSWKLNHSTLAFRRVTRSADISKGISPYGGHPLPTSQTNLTVCFINQEWFVSSH